jgi:hypothetical protein
VRIISGRAAKPPARSFHSIPVRAITSIGRAKLPLHLARVAAQAYGSDRRLLMIAT